MSTGQYDYTQVYRIEIRNEAGNKWNDGDVGHYTMENDVDYPSFEAKGLYDDSTFKGIPNWITTGEYFHKNDMDELQLAQMPAEAHDSYKSAMAQPDPVEGRAFDINELFEQLYAKYAYMKESIKDKIYDKLTVTIGWFKRDEVAEFVWHILEKYIFGCIDKLLSFIDTEENRGKLAKLIVDSGFEEDLGFSKTESDPGNINWWAVAKLGMMFVADIIWDTYIDGKGWVTSLFSSVIGGTLVDLVCDVLNGLAAAVSAVKAGVNVMVNAIESAYQFVTDLVLGLIFDLYANILQLIMFSLILGITPFIDQFSASIDGNDIIIQKEDTILRFAITSSGSKGICMKVNNQIIQIGLNTINFLTEALGGDDQILSQFVALSNIHLLGLLSSMLLITSPVAAYGFISMMLFLMSYVFTTLS